MGPVTATRLPRRPGRVVVLNGTSSSGKTTLALTLQARLAAAGECWMLISTDVMFPLLPQSFFTYGPAIGEQASAGLGFQFVDGQLVRSVGPVGWSILDAYRAWVASTAQAGLDVLVDEVLLTDDDWTDWQAALDGLDVHWVGIDIELEQLEARERTRGDRPRGLARSQYDLVHRHATYDTRVDTGVLDPHAAAEVVAAALARR